MTVSINASGTYKADRVDSADSATGWSVVKHEGSGGSPSLLGSVGTIDLVAEGTDARAARVNKQRVEIRFTDSAGYDFTTGSTGTGATKVPDGIAYVWAAFLAAGVALTKAAGGMQIALGDGTGVSCYNVAGSDTYSGGIIKWSAATEIAESENIGGAADLGDITTIGFIADVGGTTARFDNFVVDAIDVGNGLTLQGTTTTDKLFAEGLVADETTAIGVLNEVEGKIFSQGSLELSGTALTSDSESLTFRDSVGGAYTYNLDVTGTVTFNNTTIDAGGLVDYSFDSSGSTSFTMVGGGLKGFTTLITKSGDTISGSVFQDGGIGTIANTITSATFNQCGKQTITGQLDGCTINKSTATEATSGADTNLIPDCIFVKDTGTSHAFELTGATKGSAYSFSGNLTGYDAGSTGSGVQTIIGSTASGNEAILITAASGTFDISVADGASVPSVAVASGSTAVVNVTANQITIEVTVQDDTGTPINGAHVYLEKLTGHVQLINGSTNASGYISTQIDYDSDTTIKGWAREFDLLGSDRVPSDIDGQYTASGFSITLKLNTQT